MVEIILFFHHRLYNCMFTSILRTYDLFRFMWKRSFLQQFHTSILIYVKYLQCENNRIFLRHLTRGVDVWSLLSVTAKTWFRGCFIFPTPSPSFNYDGTYFEADSFVFFTCIYNIILFDIFLFTHAIAI